LIHPEEQTMSRIANPPNGEMAILRRVIDPKQPFLSKAAARAILRLDFSASDRTRMNQLAARNREGKLKQAEEEELTNYIRVGLTLGILRSKARQTLKKIRDE
jgi:hypothetical protein